MPGVGKGLQEADCILRHSDKCTEWRDLQDLRVSTQTSNPAHQIVDPASTDRGWAAEQDHAHVYGGLLALRVLARKYEFKQTEQRDVLASIVNATFPQLLVIFQVRPALCPSLGLIYFEIL